MKYSSRRDVWQCLLRKNRIFWASENCRLFRSMDVACIVLVFEANSPDIFGLLVRCEGTIFVLKVFLVQILNFL